MDDIPATGDPPSLIHFAGPLDPKDRAQLRGLIRRVEALGDFSTVPPEYGSPWIVVSYEAGPIAITRLGAEPAFAGPSAAEVAAQVRDWIEARGP